MRGVRRRGCAGWTLFFIYIPFVGDRTRLGILMDLGGASPFFLFLWGRWIGDFSCPSVGKEWRMGTGEDDEDGGMEMRADGGMNRDEMRFEGFLGGGMMDDFARSGCLAYPTGSTSCVEAGSLN